MDAAVGLVAQRNNDRARGLAASIAEALEPVGARVVVDEATAPAFGDVEGVPVATMSDCDLVVSIGGDGTFLFVAREAGDAPIVGVNLGEVGFLNAVSPADAVDTVSELVDELRTTGTVDGYDIGRLEATTPDWTLESAVNEVVVHGPRRGHGGGTTVEISVDGHAYAGSHADGVLVATPTGSTAYNLSEGGPLVRPSVDALVVTQMAAAESMPPLVVDGDSEIELHVSGADTAYAISDGRNRRELEPPETVTVTLANDPVTVAGPRGNFFDALDKLD